MFREYYIYILANKTDSTLYVGVTNDLERRVAEHRSGVIPGFTQKYHCHKLVYFERYSDVNQAIAREKQLKKWSRSKKDWLIDTMNKERVDLMGISPQGRDDKGFLLPDGRIPGSLLQGRCEGVGRDKRGARDSGPDVKKRAKF